MATLQDNVKIIQNAIYGKEMRPAIVEALNQSWGTVQVMMNAVDHLNARVDALNGGDPGGGIPSDMDELIPPLIVVNGAVTSLEVSGTSTI